MNKIMIEEIVKNVLDKMDTAQNLSIDTDNDGIFKSMNEAVEAAYIAQQKLRDCTMARKEEFVNVIKTELIKEENINLISKLGVEETGMGNFEDKVIKNRLAVEKTPGIEDLKTEAMAGDDGLTLVELSPFGVIGAITPSTNPSETVICNTIGMIAAGNSVVFAPHPSAKETTITTIKLINKALSKVNAPKNLVVTLEKPSLKEANVMMNHEK